MIITKTYKDLKPFLMEQKKGIEYPFYQILADEQIIFIVSSGLNGSEFNKTVVFFNNYPGVQVYQCLYGQGIILMQRMDEQGEAKEFKMVSISAGRQVAVPAGWVTCIVNVGKSFLVVLGNVNDHLNEVAKELEEKHGLVYYIVEKKGEISFEPNPNYHMPPQISTE